MIIKIKIKEKKIEKERAWDAPGINFQEEKFKSQSSHQLF